MAKPDQKPEIKKWCPFSLTAQATSRVERMERVDVKLKAETYRTYNGREDKDLWKYQGRIFPGEIFLFIKNISWGSQGR